MILNFKFPIKLRDFPEKILGLSLKFAKRARFQGVLKDVTIPQKES